MSHGDMKQDGYTLRMFTVMGQIQVIISIQSPKTFSMPYFHKIHYSLFLVSLVQ